jgi:ribosomal protein S18 acetylase RimI-like enzyme
LTPDRRASILHSVTESIETVSSTPPPPGVTLRHPRVPDDFKAMNAIANAARAAGGIDFWTTDEQFTTFYSHLPNCDINADVVIAERAGTMLGYGRISWHDEPEGTRKYELVVYSEPGIPEGTYTALLDVLESRGREMAAAEHVAEQQARERVLEGSSGPDHAASLEARHYLPVRYTFQMVRPNLDDLPDALLPDDLEIRPVRPDQLRTIFDAEVEAFRDHWGFAEPTEDDYAQWISDPVVGRTELWRVAWDGDQVAGMVRGYINDEANTRFDRKRGYVEHISVRRPWRRRGLARALIGSTITALREAGMTEGALGVDSENLSGALRLYLACGFEVDSEVAVYRKPLEV